MSCFGADGGGDVVDVLGGRAGKSDVFEDGADEAGLLVEAGLVQLSGGGVAVTTGGGEQDEGQSQYVELLSESARAAQRRG